MINIYNISFVLSLVFIFFLTNVICISFYNSATDFPFFCSNFARKCLILPVECSLQKSLILLEILPAEFIQALCAFHGTGQCI